MSVATRRLNQFEAGVERIEDPFAREAIQNLFALVQSLNADGFETNGKMTCRDIFTPNGFRTDNGDIEGISLNLNEGGAFRTKVFADSLANSTSKVIPAPNGIVLGFVGWTQTTSSTSGTTIWAPIETTITSTRIFLRTASGALTNTERIELRNNSGATRLYRGVLFYKEETD